MGPADKLIKKLDSIGDLDDAEIAMLHELPFQVTKVARGDDAVTEGLVPHNCCLLIDGFLHRYKALADGGRQILSFHPPGDIPDLQSLHIHYNDHSLAASVDSTVAYISHEAMDQLCRRSFLLSSLLWRDTLIDASMFREWILRMGRQPPHRRVAHLMCEEFARSWAIGISEGNACRFPVTQNDLADALGLSLVHTNRSLQQARASGCLTFEAGVLTIHDWAGACALAEFEDGYMHLKPDHKVPPDLTSR